MPEPDFEQLARLIGEETGAARLDEWEYGTFDRALAMIAEQLRQVWNARGAADLAALDATMPYTADGVIVGVRSGVVRAIRRLDR